MDSDRFDSLARTFTSRRAALGGLLGGLVALLGRPNAEEASAHNPIPACRRIADPVKRRKCLARARRHNRQQHFCKPQPVAVTCANRCGPARNNCKKAVSCTCPAGKTCLANGGCVSTCSQPQLTCPPGCACTTYFAETPGVFPAACVAGTGTFSSCDQIPLSCVTSANCPRGYFCGYVAPACGTNRCVPNCPS